MQRPYRVVVAKVGLEGHDRGAQAVVRARMTPFPRVHDELASRGTSGVPRATMASLTTWLADTLDQREAAFA